MALFLFTKQKYLRGLCLAVAFSTLLPENLGHFGLLHNAFFGHFLQQLCSTDTSPPRGRKLSEDELLILFQTTGDSIIKTA